MAEKVAKYAIGGLDRMLFSPEGPVRVITESSIWFLEPAEIDGPGGRYLRMPRAEQPRRATPSVTGRLDDGTWHRYRSAWWKVESGLLKLNIKPEVGPKDGIGIVTGVVVEVARR